MGRPEAELSLVLTDDAGITELNSRYLDRDHTTNVISFPQLEGGFHEVEPHMLGDVVVNLDAAGREAEAAGESESWALIRLIIHGILHLVGYDHEKPDSDAAAMEARSRELLNLVTGSQNR